MKMTTEIMEKLIAEATKARRNAYAPYSGFTVGAALLASSGKIYSGCNMENGAYSPSLCAERGAFAAAVAAGERRFDAIAIVGDGENPCYPCGVCRQVIAEFCQEDFLVITAAENGKYETVSLKELLPKAFRLK